MNTEIQKTIEYALIRVISNVKNSVGYYESANKKDCDMIIQVFSDKITTELEGMLGQLISSNERRQQEIDRIKFNNFVL